MVHGNRIHEPCHDLLIGVDIGGGNITVVSDEGRNFRREAAGEVFELAQRQFGGVYNHPPLGAAKGNVYDRAFPCHPHGESADFIERNVLMITDAAFAGSARDIVLDAIARKGFYRPVIHTDGKVSSKFALRGAEDATEVLFQSHKLGSEIKLLLGNLIGRFLFG